MDYLKSKEISDLEEDAILIHIMHNGFRMKHADFRIAEILRS